MHLPVTFEEIVNEIVKFTDYSRQEAEYKVWMQALQPGWNVLQDAAKFGVTPHQYNEKMIQLYREGDSFIFETLVFWAKPHRMHWTYYGLERIRQYATRTGIPVEDIKILMLGDGTGNDSMFLAINGLSVDYYDVPGSKTFEFAVKRFESYGFLDHRINLINDYQSSVTQQYDVVVCFEVLEHLPRPNQTIEDISTMLKFGGVALITEDFDDIVEHLPTHLEANLKFSGRTPFLFFRNDMLLNWYGQEQLFKPSEYVKLRRKSAVDWLSLLKDANVRRMLFSPYFKQTKQLMGKVLFVGS